MAGSLDLVRKGANGQLRGLVAQFLFGIAMVTFADFDPESSAQPSTLHEIFLAAHMLVAVTLLVGSVWIVVSAKRSGRRDLVSAAWLGLVSIAASTLSGILTISTGAHELFAFLMGLFFIAAVIAYGRILVSLGGAKTAS